MYAFFVNYNVFFVNYRFLFVNYNAWHYVGCDVLWAGIAKALAEKVEEEFGVFTTRLFRSITLKTETEPDRQQRKLLIEFNDEKVSRNMNENIFKNCLNEYDIAESFSKLEKDLERENCWIVEYTDASNARRAHTKLQYFKNIKRVSFAPSSITSLA